MITLTRTVFLLSLLWLTACNTGRQQQKEQTEASADAAKAEGEGWIQLFNGENLEGWIPKIRGQQLGENYHNTFRVEDGLLRVAYDEYDDFKQQYGHLFYQQPFSRYKLRLEYRFTGEQAPGGEGWAIRNSGVMVHGQAPETMGIHQDFPISVEIQLLGGNGTEERPTANVCTPGTEVYMQDELITDHCINSGSRTYHGEQWVTLEVEVLGHESITHIVEGDTVLSYSRPRIGGGVVNDYIDSVKQDGAPLKEGYISLQSESHPVEFRKVELLPLD